MPRVVEKELFGIHICRIMDQNVDESTQGANPLPEGYKVYLWNKDKGAENLGTWVGLRAGLLVTWSA